MRGSSAERLPTSPARPHIRRPYPQSRRVFADGQLVGGRYRIVQFLGAGGMGEVYEAYDALLETVVAVKTLRGAHTGVEVADARSLRREALVARKVRHPNVCRVLKCGAHKNRAGGATTIPFIVMERIHG